MNKSKKERVTLLFLMAISLFGFQNRNVAIFFKFMKVKYSILQNLDYCLKLLVKGGLEKSQCH